MQYMSEMTLGPIKRLLLISGGEGQLRVSDPNNVKFGLHVDIIASPRHAEQL